VSIGEALDRLSILELKLLFIKDPSQNANVQKEYKALKKATSALKPVPDSLYTHLKDTNARLWDIEHDIRTKERKKEFDNHFIELARSVYKVNDLRSSIKKKINIATNSSIIEEKHYKNEI